MNTPVRQLRRVRCAARFTLTLGVAASVAANILHTQPGPIAQTIAAWPPPAMLLTIELIARVPVDPRVLAAATAIAAIAAWVSYRHMAGVAVIWSLLAAVAVDLGVHVVDMSGRGWAPCPA